MGDSRGCATSSPMRARTKAGKPFGGIQLGAKNEDTSCNLDGKPSIGLGIFQQPGSNALDTADGVRDRGWTSSNRAFRPTWTMRSSTTRRRSSTKSIQEVFKALRDAIILVAIVVLAFLQSWRATLIPLIAVPVAIVGTFAVMLGMGFSLNNLSLFGLVLAIGIVVDDAIVVVEAVEHHLEHGLSPKAGRRKGDGRGDRRRSSPFRSCLMCVFIPCAFITGITGQFFRQFALTIAVSTFFSAVNSLTLSPALCGLVARSRKHEQRDPLTWLLNLLLGWFFKLFNSGFKTTANVYAGGVGILLQLSVIVLVVYGGLLVSDLLRLHACADRLHSVARQRLLLVDVRLPDSSSLERTQEVMAQVEKIARGEAQRPHDEPRLSGPCWRRNSRHRATRSRSPANRSSKTPSARTTARSMSFSTNFIIATAAKWAPTPSRPSFALLAIAKCRKPQVAVFGAPPVDGLGNAGGFKVMVRDIAARDSINLQEAADGLAASGNQQPGLVGLFSAFRVANAANVCRYRSRAVQGDARAAQRSLPHAAALSRRLLHQRLQPVRPHVASEFAGRSSFSLEPRASAATESPQSQWRNGSAGQRGLRRRFGGPALVIRYNGVTAAAINGGSLPGVSSGTVIKTVDKVAKRELPQGMNMQWTELTLLANSGRQHGDHRFCRGRGARVSWFLPRNTKA